MHHGGEVRRDGATRHRRPEGREVGGTTRLVDGGQIRRRDGDTTRRRRDIVIRDRRGRSAYPHPSGVRAPSHASDHSRERSSSRLRSR